MQDVYVTAMDIHWADHLMAQAVWQDWIGNAIAKTINMPYDATTKDVKAAYLMAHEMGLKGLTVYRDGSRHKQVLHMTSADAKKRFEVECGDYVREYISSRITNDYIKEHVASAIAPKVSRQNEIVDTTIKPETPDENLCPTCKSTLIYAEGCSMCIECGYSGCTSG